MNVAVPGPLPGPSPPLQHSPRFGQLASSHTVWRSWSRSVDLISANRCPAGTRLFSQSGFRRRLLILLPRSPRAKACGLVPSCRVPRSRHRSCHRSHHRSCHRSHHRSCHRSHHRSCHRSRHGPPRPCRRGRDRHSSRRRVVTTQLNLASPPLRSTSRRQGRIPAANTAHGVSDASRGFHAERGQVSCRNRSVCCETTQATASNWESYLFLR